MSASTFHAEVIYFLYKTSKGNSKETIIKTVFKALVKYSSQHKSFEVEKINRTAVAYFFPFPYSKSQKSKYVTLLLAEIY